MHPLDFFQDPGDELVRLLRKGLRPSIRSVHNTLCGLLRLQDCRTDGGSCLIISPTFILRLTNPLLKLPILFLHLAKISLTAFIRTALAVNLLLKQGNHLAELLIFSFFLFQILRDILNLILKFRNLFFQLPYSQIQKSVFPVLPGTG